MSAKLFVAAVAAVSFAAALSAQQDVKPQPLQYKEYSDFQWKEVVVRDDKAGDNVRYHADFTLPVHGPWLLNPSGNSITIVFITRVACAAGVEYRVKGTEEWTRVWKTAYGMLDFRSDLHHFHLKNLKENTEYEYRIINTTDQFFYAYQVLSTGREIYSFQTMDPEKKNYKCFFTADLHGSSRLCLRPLMNAVGGYEQFDHFFFAGDIVVDNCNNLRYYITFGFLDDIGALWGKSKPTVYLRGNHDISGSQYNSWGDYFPRTDEKTYFAFRQGPALFINLDSMWPQGGKFKLSVEQYKAYLKEQAEWIQKLKKTDDWKKSTFRVVTLHVGTHASEAFPWVSDALKEALNGSTDADRIHLMLFGHHHVYWRVDPRTTDSKVAKLYRGIPRFPADFNYTAVSMAQIDAFVMEVSPRSLICKSYDWRHVPVSTRDSFEVFPDGSVKDLQEVKTFRNFEPPAAKKK